MCHCNVSSSDCSEAWRVVTPSAGEAVEFVACLACASTVDVWAVGALCTGTEPTLFFGAPVSDTGAGGDEDARSSLSGVQSHV